MTDIEWEEPPSSPLARGSLFTREVRLALQANPGRWACIRRDTTSNQPLYQYSKSHPEYEVKSVRVAAKPVQRYDLYARYNTPED